MSRLTASPALGVLAQGSEALKQDLDATITGEGRPLVLLHSLLQDRSSFDELARRLQGVRRVCNVNLPGFGASPPAESLAGYADRVADAMEGLGIGESADVCGNGLGGSWR